jgi:hypothetical protein
MPEGVSLAEMSLSGASVDSAADAAFDAALLGACVGASFLLLQPAAENAIAIAASKHTNFVAFIMFPPLG